MDWVFIGLGASSILVGIVWLHDQPKDVTEKEHEIVFWLLMGLGIFLLACATLID